MSSLPSIAVSSLSTSNLRLEVHTLSSDFRKATHIIHEERPIPGPDQVVIRTCWVGINASDINQSNGKYNSKLKPPFGAGMEGVGQIVECGIHVDQQQYTLGQTVMYAAFGAFTQYIALNTRALITIKKIQKPQPWMVTIPVSAMTASLALEKVGEMETANTHHKQTHKAKKQTILVTAAAGGTGMFALQMALAEGHHVIATVGTDEKAHALRTLGVQRVVNYKKEKLQNVLSKEYPKGVDIVYECVGGEQYEAAVRNLAVHGKCIIIGFIQGYASGEAWKSKAPSLNVPALILGKSASVRGFFLENFRKDIPRHTQQILSAVQAGKIKCIVDSTQFNGLEAIPDAIDHLYSGKNIGKVVVKIADPLPFSKL